MPEFGYGSPFAAWSPGDPGAGVGDGGWGGGWTPEAQAKRGKGRGRGKQAALAWLPEELRNLMFPEMERQMTLEETGMKEWAWDPQVGWLYGGVRVPSGPEGLQPMDPGLAGAGFEREAGYFPELAARQADYYGLTGTAKEQFVSDVMMGLPARSAAARAGHWTPASYELPPNIAEDPQLVAEYLRMRGRGREAGATPEQLGRFAGYVSKAEAPAYEEWRPIPGEELQPTPLWGYQTRGLTLGEYGQEIGAYAPEMNIPELEQPDLNAMLQQLETDDPYYLYGLRLRDYLATQLQQDDLQALQIQDAIKAVQKAVNEGRLSAEKAAQTISKLEGQLEGLMTSERANEILDDASRRAGHNIPLEQLPYYLESRDVTGESILAWGEQSAQERYRRFEVARGRYGGGVPTGIAGAPGVTGRVGRPPIEGPGPPGGYPPAPPSPEMLRGQFYTYVKGLNLSFAMQNWLISRYSQLYAMWSATGQGNPFFTWLEEYLATGGERLQRGYETRRLAPSARHLNY